MSGVFEFYVQGTELPLDESSVLEFKGHRSFSVEEVPVREERSRQNISRCFCAMLNANRGGSIIVGVLDTGRIDGLMLTELQKDHVRCSIADCVSRFRPAVPSSLYEVRFVPVILPSDHIDMVTGPLSKPEEVIYDDRFPSKHLLRASSWCWCDCDALAKFQSGFLSPLYVIEIDIKPSDGPQTFLFRNEENQCYMRRNATNQILSEGAEQALLSQLRQIQLE